nr:conjugal pilus assembly protein TraF [Raoultella sp. NCTC 9187]
MRTIHAAMLAGCLCCALMPAWAKDAGWQWYNEKAEKTGAGYAARACGSAGPNGHYGKTRRTAERHQTFTV